MAVFYVNPQDTGSLNTGTQDEPFVSAQSAIDAITTATGAPHTIYAQGTQVLTTALDFSSVQDGSTSLGFIEFIGVNSSWVEDGTPFTIDGNNSINYMNSGSVNYWNFRNIDVIKFYASGIYSIGSYHVFKNCHFFDNRTEGVRSVTNSVWNKCSAYNNGSEGFKATGFFMFCKTFNNGSHGISGNDITAFGCISYGNGGYGYSVSPNYIGGCINCVGYDNTNNNFRISCSRTCFMVGCRSTESDTVGYDAGTNGGYEDYNFFLNNANGAYSGNCFSGGNSEYSGVEGYIDAANGDFNLDPDTASMVNVPISLA